MNLNPDTSPSKNPEPSEGALERNPQKDPRRVDDVPLGEPQSEPGDRPKEEAGGLGPFPGLGFRVEGLVFRVEGLGFPYKVYSVSKGIGWYWALWA